MLQMGRHPVILKTSEPTSCQGRRGSVGAASSEGEQALQVSFRSLHLGSWYPSPYLHVTPLPAFEEYGGGDFIVP